MKLRDYCTKIIRYSFYALFLLVPLVVTNTTSELFELNKMWLTWGLTVLIIASWGVKMIAEKTFRVQRTPLDIPILLFLAAHIIATLFSLDSRISFWGYYSRFNGGLLSFLSYILLYYAFVTHFTLAHVRTLLKVILAGGLIVALWGIPSHFGYDPTCLLFRGSLDVSCWTDAFQPKVRIFSTIGQPAWLAAYLAALIPLASAFFLAHFLKKEQERLPLVYYGILVVLFYVGLIFTDTRGGFLGFWIGNIVFWGVLFLKGIVRKKAFLKTAGGFLGVFLLLNFMYGIPVSQLTKFTLPEIQKNTQEKKEASPAASATPTGELGGTDSGRIRLLVWKGAIDAWKANPIFGTGVETFAFAYYKHRPVEHNTTSEWDYLYNKAHNEYLNYLTTTGAFGLGAYLLFIGLFIFIILKSLPHTSIAPLLQNILALAMEQPAEHRLSNQSTESVSSSEKQSIDSQMLTTGLFAGFVTILVTNFFGFSVVIINLFFFIFPASVLLLAQKIDDKRAFIFGSQAKHGSSLTLSQMAGVSGVLLVSIILLYTLFSFREADKAYALGSNLQRAREYEQAYQFLEKAVSIRQDPLFRDELAVNNATLATAYFLERNDATTAAQLADNAVQISNDVVATYPNNIVYWKDRVRVFYSLSQLDGQYITPALDAMKKVIELSPTDAKARYNLGVLYGEIGNYDDALRVLKEAHTLKPMYKDAYFAEGLFYREMAKDKNGTIVQPEMSKKAVDTMKYILKEWPNDEQATQILEEWKEL